MLFILGGAARSGKTLISRKLLEEKNIPYFCIDYLVTALERYPSLDIKHGQPFIAKSEKLWTSVFPLMAHLEESEPNYLVEGDGILPKQISELQTKIDDLKVCFVGYTNIVPTKKLNDIRKSKAVDDDWPSDYKDEDLLPMISDMIEFSKYLKKECEKYNIQYFDCSQNFEECQKQIFNFFTKT